MFKVENYSETLEEKYNQLHKQLLSLIEGEKNIIANLSNASALLNVFLDNVNWVGFYLYEEETLVLGPFQGLPACIRIPLGRGVCGTAAQDKETLIINDVEQFPGHIACDAASRSEIVIPIFKNEELFGVLDIDSPILNRFSKEEGQYLQEFIKILEAHL
ncbi:MULTISPECIES: GAF domain-containing protein [Bacillus]|uniref:GAF domain-containing protein n=1 Tax=Bacillus TaxID=1386 RepID=UPI00030DF916|nr:MULTISPECIES: GAF domain-containing protein [Bacillus]